MKNWAGNLEYAASSVASPESVEQLAELVAGAGRVKALGSRHCFNDVADTDGVQVVLDGLPRSVEVDSARRVARVAGGLTYGELGRALEDQGWALHNLASLPHISVAGAVQTGTHGSGISSPALASAVKAVELVRASGEVERLEEGDGDEFLGSVVGLGALGIVTAFELAIEPTYQVRQQVFEGLPWETVLADYDAVAGDGYSVSLFTDYAGDAVPQAWRKVRVDAEAGPAPSSFFGAVPATQPRHPLPDMDALNCTQQLDVPGPWLDRLPHFRREFTPSAGDELQTEYLLPRAQAPGALQAVRGLAARLTRLLFVSEIRTVAADEFWLSPSYRQDSVALHFTWRPLQAEVEAFLPELEAALAPFGARPHWGKLFAVPTAELARLYPRFEDFRELVTKRDPEGKFGNAYLERVLGPIR
ncbi:D-arabinono-1,4-lactone oxidase [Sinomonas sp. ASV322]|uniref:D-arabinono-1,4-lactone oxidase n=1 Tax=Sinomonas sp. ASV322 TaxID=3041920 RepID=UPI0027DBDBFA|nr:D-arabinono-1,4-lactone oxidase [Sinomonas sp. ASV322]MDQ4502903.1 D-arabinono-1,4-lactone oxidase [Sinomonas sp. ASV322]